MILKNARYLDETGKIIENDIEIKNKRIVRIAKDLSGDEIIDLESKFLMPGLIDVHVHLREPGYEDKETIKSGSLAAARGGFTRICAMPNTNPVIDSVEKLREVEKIIEKDACVKVHQIAAIHKDLTSSELVDIKAMDAIAYSNDGKGVQSSDDMYWAMKELRKHNKMLIAHTEDESLLFDGVMHEGIKNKELGLKGIMSAVESVQLARDILLANETGVAYHICHVSTKESVELIRMAHRLNIDVSAEVTAHHLLLSEMDVLEDDAVYKMNPPLRGLEDQRALLSAVQDRSIAIIASDHAPHTKEEKSHGFNGSPFGIIGSELTFPLLYTHLVLENKLTLFDLQELMSINPAKRFNFENSFIKEGMLADLAVFDLKSRRKSCLDDLASKSQNTPFLNQELQGYCDMTLVDGKIVWRRA